MKLSRQERWVLANQYLILEALYPDEADGFAYFRDALERGYEGDYAEISEHIYDERHTLSESECRSVVLTMSMFDALEDSYEALPDKAGINAHDVEFLGYDGNNETEYMSYARHYTKGMGGRFTHLKRYPDFNSHRPSVERYEKMLKAWEDAGKPLSMTASDLQQVIDAGRTRD